MSRRFTSEDILRYLYGEMDPGESDQFLSALLSDEDLLAEFENLKAVQSGLGGLSLSPSRESSERISRAAKRASNRASHNRKESYRKGHRRTVKGVGTSTIVMLCVTFAAACGAMFSYLYVYKNSSTWEMTSTRASFVDSKLDERLQGARNRLEGILDDRQEVIAPVHHDTYRVMRADWDGKDSREVTFLQLK